MSENNYTAFNAMADIITSPTKAFEHIRNHTSWLWYPLIIGLGLAITMVAYFYSWIDFEWFIDEQIAALPPENRAEAGEQMRSFMSPTFTIGIGSVFLIIFTFIIYLVQAAYLHLANKLTTQADIRFGQWFSMSCWAWFVSIFSSLAGFVAIFMSDTNKMPPDALAPLSMNSLVVHAEQGAAWFTWANSITLITFWVLALTAIGFSTWTGASKGKAFAIAALPYLLIFGIWAAVI